MSFVCKIMGANKGTVKRDSEYSLSQGPDETLFNISLTTLVCFMNTYSFFDTVPLCKKGRIVVYNCAAYIGIGGMRTENEPRH